MSAGLFLIVVGGNVLFGWQLCRLADESRFRRQLRRALADARRRAPDLFDQDDEGWRL